MIKKHIIILLAILAGFFPAVAQQATGSWQLFDLYAGNPSSIIVSNNGPAYIVSGGRLYSYNLKDEEFVDYFGDLNGSNILFYQYNSEKGFLLLVYNDSNMDIIYDDGRIYNLPDIKDAVVDYNKEVNGADFKGNSMYVATSFGVVEFDISKRVVKQSGVYGKNTKEVAVMGDYLVLLIDNHMYYAPRDKRINRFDVFEKGDEVYFKEMRAIPGSDYMCARAESAFRVYGVGADGKPELKSNTFYPNNQGIMSAPNAIYFVSDNRLVKYENNGVGSVILTLPSDISSSTIGCNKGLSEVWAGNTQGVSCYNLTNVSSPTLLCKNVKPDNAMVTARVTFFAPSADGSTLYMANMGPGGSNPGGYSLEGNGCYMTVDRLRGGIFSDATATKKASVVTSDVPLQAPASIVVDPNDPDVFYAGSRFSYIIKVKDGEAVDALTGKQLGLSLRVYGLEFDPQGNLFFGTSDFNTVANDRKVLYMIPKDKLEKGLSNLTSEDIVAYPTPGNIFNREGIIRYFNKSNLMVLTSAATDTGLILYDMNNTPEDKRDDTYNTIKTIIDVDGNSKSIGNLKGFAEDNDGKLWLVNNTGVYVLDNPRDGLTSSARWIRPKVPRNDGTNFADYLLDGVSCVNVSVDGQNRKWIATLTSGVYLVSPDGTEIIANYNTTNSPLGTDAINNVYADPRTNMVYIGTNAGVYRFASDSSVPADDYSAVYAYPNPVRPDYSGWITINGLMDNSLVKIVDSGMNVVYQGKSKGGMMTWDGCNHSGQRVKSGVYYVMASQNSNGSASATVTKILVLN